mgnify:CR=1 FL=1
MESWNTCVPLGRRPTRSTPVRSPVFGHTFVRRHDRTGTAAHSAPHAARRARSSACTASCPRKRRSSLSSRSFSRCCAACAAATSSEVCRAATARGSSSRSAAGSAVAGEKAFDRKDLIGQDLTHFYLTQSLGLHLFKRPAIYARCWMKESPPEKREGSFGSVLVTESIDPLSIDHIPSFQW